MKTEIMKIFCVVLVVITCLVKAGTCLDYEREEEGSCNSEPKVAKNLNITWFGSTNFRYIVAGSKYHLFRLATTTRQEHGHLPDYKFYYEACLQPYFNVEWATAHVLSFGSKKNKFRVSEESPGILQFREVTRNYTRDTSINYVTLTDNKSFVFFANCWTKADQRGWDVISTRRVLGKREVAQIEEHALSLGFNPEQFVFLKCVK